MKIDIKSKLLIFAYSLNQTLPINLDFKERENHFKTAQIKAN